MLQINVVLLNFLQKVPCLPQKCVFMLKKKNVSRAPNQHIRMISEESCGTED